MREDRKGKRLYTLKNQNQVCYQVRSHIQGLLVFGAKLLPRRVKRDKIQN